MLALIFGLIVLASFLLMSVMEENLRESVEQRLRRLVKQRKSLESFVTRDLPGEPLNPGPDADLSQRRSAKDAIVGAVERATLGRTFSNTLGLRLQRADWKWKPAEFMVAQGLSASMGLGVAVISVRALWWLFLILGWVAPHILLARAESKRLKEFENQLPDALSIVSNALRSGYSFLQAIDTVGREMPDPVAKEFTMVLRETRVNIPLDEALTNLTSRVKSPDLDLVVTAVIIQRQVGGNLSEVLEKIGGTIKERIRMQGEIRTLTTQGRFSGWIVSLLPVALAVMMQMVSPGFLDPMFGHPFGWVLIGVGVLMQAIGILMIRSMVNLEV